MGQEHDDRPNDDNTPEMKTDITFPPIGEEEQPETPQETDVEARLRMMEERAEQDRQAFQEERNRWQQTVDRLIQSQPQQAAPQPEPQQSVDFSDLPDPVDKPEEYKKALAQRFEQEMQKRLSSSFENYEQRQNSQRTTAQQLDDVWNRFQQNYSDLAAKEITLKGAVLAEREAMQQRNIDPQQGILSDPDGFMERVASRMRNELGITNAPSPTQTTPPPASAPGQQQVNRTAGVGGGSNMNNSGGKKDKRPPAFSEQLKEMQLQNGLI